MFRHGAVVHTTARATTGMLRGGRMPGAQARGHQDCTRRRRFGGRTNRLPRHHVRDKPRGERALCSSFRRVRRDQLEAGLQWAAAVGSISEIQVLSRSHSGMPPSLPPTHDPPSDPTHSPLSSGACSRDHFYRHAAHAAREAPAPALCRIGGAVRGLRVSRTRRHLRRSRRARRRAHGHRGRARAHVPGIAVHAARGSCAPGGFTALDGGVTDNCPKLATARAAARRALRRPPAELQGACAGSTSSRKCSGSCASALRTVSHS